MTDPLDAWISAELEVCEGATEGPWVSNKHPFEHDWIRQKEWSPCGDPAHNDCAIAQTVHTVAVSLRSHDDATANAIFIANARDGYPKALLALREAREREKVLREALEFYANRKSWEHVEGHNLGNGALLSVAAIDESDTEEDEPIIGGKRARAALAATDAHAQKRTEEAANQKPSEDRAVGPAEEAPK